MSGPPPLRPLVPLAKRLNQNALIVAAVILGMTVLTAIVVVHPSHEARDRSAPLPVGEVPPVPSRPSFLDQPVRAPAGSRDTSNGVMPRSGHDVATPPSPTDLGVPESDRFVGVAGPSARQRAYQAALASPLVVASPSEEPAPGREPARLDTTPLAAQEQQLLTVGDSIMRAAVGTPTSGGTSTATTADRRHHGAFLATVGAAHGATVMPDIDAAGSPYTLRAGTVIPGLLLTAINSDLPGDLIGQVSHDVYDSRTQRVVLIPKGARLIGTYDNQVAVGEDRLLVAWTRLIFPDGRGLRLPGLALKDEEGQTGAKDQVNTHWRRAFGSALLLSAISAGVQLSQPRQTSVLGAPSAGQVAAGALGQELSSVALELLRRGTNTPPTITIRQGHPFNVFLNGDLVFDGPYADHPESAR